MDVVVVVVDVVVVDVEVVAVVVVVIVAVVVVVVVVDVVVVLVVNVVVHLSAAAQHSYSFHLVQQEPVSTGTQPLGQLSGSIPPKRLSWAQHFVGPLSSQLLLQLSGSKNPRPLFSALSTHLCPTAALHPAAVAVRMNSG